jgi:hypothetical protein
LPQALRVDRVCAAAKQTGRGVGKGQAGFVDMSRLVTTKSSPAFFAVDWEAGDVPGRTLSVALDVSRDACIHSFGGQVAG